MHAMIRKISRVLLVLCMFVLLTLGNAHAGVCDEFGLDASDSYYIPAPITKFCVLAGSDPPKKWVPEKGFGKGLTSLHSGLQVVTGKASSLCPSPKMGDGAKGCPNFQFPNCATIPSDNVAQQTAQAKSGACVKGDATIQETANASENDVDETYEEITADDIKCAVQYDLSTVFVSEDAPQSVCYGGNAKFCSSKGEKDTCDTKDDSELPNTDYPHDFALDGYVQMNDVKSIYVGSAWLPDLRGNGYSAFESMSEADQEMMMNSMFQMTGDFKTTAETLLELNNDMQIAWKKVNKNFLGIRTSVDVLEVKCTNSTIVIPKGTLFSIRNIPGFDTLQKFIIFWNNAPVLFRRNVNSGSREGDVALQSRFVGLMPPAGNVDLTQWMSRDDGDGGKNPDPIPKLPYLSLQGTPLMKSGNTSVFKQEIAPYPYGLTSGDLGTMYCNVFRPGGVGFKLFMMSNFDHYTPGSENGDYFFRNCAWNGGGLCGCDRPSWGTVKGTVDDNNTVVQVDNLNAPMRYRSCGMRQCTWSWTEIANGKLGCDGKADWHDINLDHVYSRTSW